jgi:hypothetical protein
MTFLLEHAIEGLDRCDTRPCRRRVAIAAPPHRRPRQPASAGVNTREVINNSLSVGPPKAIIKTGIRWGGWGEGGVVFKSLSAIILLSACSSPSLYMFLNIALGGRVFSHFAV